ncbi:flagellar basal body-associated FliL family protein [Hasllibacter sp. MH4015]|uniref:flagellar basal body-associated FliL family protein n=1 Tax=Hasllibacter sp. MH4015 TaxID=2854029 RepID=UPI001CD313FB|nr:flagellar basal body-associated FliL family protein [Hasllibacter sp. MH4015]
MMRMLLPVLLLLLGAGGGIGAGMMLAGGDVPSDDVEEVAGTSSDEGGEDDVAEDDGEPSPVEQTGEGTEYVRLNNQFVVPIVRNGSVRALVVMGLTVEVNTGQNSSVFNREPRLRDSFLRVLFAHANAGGFDGMFTEAAAMAPLREGLREAAIGVLGDAVVHDVLITDLTRQDA